MTVTLYSRPLKDNFVGALTYCRDTPEDIALDMADFRSKYPEERRSKVKASPRAQKELLTQYEASQQQIDDYLSALNYLRKLGRHVEPLYNAEQKRVNLLGSDVVSLTRRPHLVKTLNDFLKKAQEHLEYVVSFFSDEQLAQLRGVDLTAPDAREQLEECRTIEKEELHDMMEVSFWKIHLVRLGLYSLTAGARRSLKEQQSLPENRHILAARIVSNSIFNYFPADCITLPDLTDEDRTAGASLCQTWERSAAQKTKPVIKTHYSQGLRDNVAEVILELFGQLQDLEEQEDSFGEITAEKSMEEIQKDDVVQADLIDFFEGYGELVQSTMLSLNYLLCLREHYDAIFPEIKSKIAHLGPSASYFYNRNDLAKLGETVIEDAIQKLNECLSFCTPQTLGAASIERSDEFSDTLKRKLFSGQPEDGQVEIRPCVEKHTLQERMEHFFWLTYEYRLGLYPVSKQLDNWLSEKAADHDCRVDLAAAIMGKYAFNKFPEPMWPGLDDFTQQELAEAQDFLAEDEPIEAAPPVPTASNVFIFKPRHP